ncbi:MAG: hypothetical protein GVY18_13535 [Bacteroidetes bacterium]|jgi:hypothetical protein|nr:hypothetical protein [Bacteroidota bacterium]
MLRALLALLLLAVTLGPPAANAQAPPEAQGVLLGLRLAQPIPKPLPYYATSTDSTARSVYRTLFLTHSDSTFRVEAATSGLLIPRPDEFWRVGVKRSIYNDWVEDFAWAAPQGTLPRWSGIQPYNGEYCEGHRVQDVLYAGPAYLALEQRSAGYCEGAAHPWLFNTLAVVPIDSVTHTGLTIDQVLGEPAQATLKQATTDYLARLRDPKRRAQLSSETDPANWALRHQQGRWRVVGRLDGVDESAQEVMVDLPLQVALPPSLLGRPMPSLSWSAIQEAVPDAVDAVIAPDESWVVVLHPQRLTVHRIEDDGVGPARLERRLSARAAVVMDRWATGERLTRWQRRLQATLDAES